MPSFVGVLEAAIGAGAVGGGLTAARAIRRLGEPRVLALGLIAIAVGVLPMVVPALPVVLGGLLVVGAGLPWALVALFTALQRHTPLHLQGRVYSAVDLLVSPPQTVSIAVGAALSAVLDFRILVVAITVVVLASGSWLLSRRPEPAVISDAVRTQIPA